MKTILVSGASGIVGYGALKSLRSANRDYKLIGSTIYKDSVAPAFCDFLELAPATSKTEYIDWLCKIINKHSIDLIIPGINDDMIAWNEKREEIFARSNTKLMLNSQSLITLSIDKWEFYKVLSLNCPQYAIDTRTTGNFDELRDAFGLPFLLKPRRGYASKGIVLIESERTFAEHEAELGVTLIAQPIVGNHESEYTVSAFFDAKSNLCCWMSLRRKLSQQGFTEKAEVAAPHNTEAALSELASVFSPIGPTNFQFRIDHNRLKLLEINPRISSATSIRTAFGYNESDMAVRYFLEDITPEQPIVRRGCAVRYTEDMIFYDCNSL